VTLQSGIVLGAILNLINIVLNIYSVYLLLDAEKMTGLSSFSELGYYCFGSVSIYIINLALAMVSVGMPIAYFIIFSHTAAPLL
jgi:hypothetical protein